MRDNWKAHQFTSQSNIIASWARVSCLSGFKSQLYLLLDLSPWVTQPDFLHLWWRLCEMMYPHANCMLASMQCWLLEPSLIYYYICNNEKMHIDTSQLFSKQLFTTCCRLCPKDIMDRAPCLPWRTHIEWNDLLTAWCPLHENEAFEGRQYVLFSVHP